jgi:serine/threonine-protein kinase
MPPRVGQVVNSKYRLLRHIGDGGMGSVFEARHENLGTTVALKFLHLEFTRKQGLVQRFLQEARASARIQSEHVVRVADVDQTAEGDVFIVLEYLEGQTLQALYEELYKSGRRLSYVDALSYAVQILDGVEAAHRAGIVHRDLKPDNVMITADPRGVPLVKLLDFGIAKLKVIAGNDPKLTRPGVIMGTPEYMAPEQSSSADTVDARADIFSLGVMIFEMLAGRRPVGGDDAHELAAAYRTGQIEQLADLVPGIAPSLAAAVHRAMAPKPEGRFAAVSDLRDVIEPFAAAVRPPSPSRLRAGGTVGVSLAVVPPHAVAPAPLPPVPPPGPPPEPPAEARVAKTWPPESGEAPAPPPRVSNTQPDAESPPAHGGATVKVAEPYVPAMAPPPRPPTNLGRRRKRGTPVGVIVGGALAVAAVVTGIVYLSTRSSSSDDDPPKHHDAPPAQTAAPTPPVPPPPGELPVAPVPLPAVPPATPPAAPPPTRPTGPAPRPSGSAAPSAAPPTIPFVPPAMLSALPQLPFPLPGQPPAAPPGSSKPPEQPAPQPPLFPPLQ